ncbi:MAG: HEAT repeat domain-containing protein [Daejeonella sp.]|uniref:HEAT repeat domain-containing protein n=1 Tax=Daejeonella sp. JGW-45 TaxID=3034148 RepID=UPI0023EBCEEC|nr:HEAT repeat domain-containing protein [Daejeonella sp. JGW-45]
MAFYDLNKDARTTVLETINSALKADIQSVNRYDLLKYFGDPDTYIRKSAYQSTGRIYFSEKHLQNKIIQLFDELISHEDHSIRQTTVNAAGEIGKVDFEIVRIFFDTGLLDPHHTVRNAVIGSVKKMGEVNPKPVLAWAQEYLHHPDKEIRREICHGIELRGRKYPEDVLPLLKELENDQTTRVSNTLIHVLGQIAYKKGCLKTVVEHLGTWTNKKLVASALEEIIDVHHRYKNFAALTQDEARKFISDNYASAD